MHKNFLKLISIAFIIFITISIQSCKIYDTGAAPELEAVASAKKVEVITVDGKTYKFEKLIVEDEQLVGISKPNSKAAKYLPSEKFVDSNGHKMEKVSIDRATVKEINLYDKKKSKRKTILLVVSLTLCVAVLAAVAAAAAVAVAVG